MHEEKVIDRLENPPVIKNTKQIDLGDMPEDMDAELGKAAIFEIVEETLSKFHDTNLESKAARHNIANEIFKHIVNEGFVYKVIDKEFGGDTGVDADYEQALADETSKLSRTMEDILIDLITVHYNHDKLMSVNDFDSYCILAEETYNQENGEV